MQRVRILPLILLSITTAGAGDKDKDKGKFEPGPASSYATHQTQARVTIAAVPYTTPEQVRSAFGKMDPLKYGVLPVLVVIQNDSEKALKIDLKAEYENPDRSHIEATPAQDVTYLPGPKVPRVGGSAPLPIPLPRRNKKGPLGGWEIEGRAFAVKMLPARESASGFVYFQTSYKPGSHLFLTGLREAGTGKELFYFEIPLDAN